MNETNVADVLDNAADVLEANGWCRGNARRLTEEGGVEYCAVGAIRSASGLFGLTDQMLLVQANENYKRIVNLSVETEQALQNYIGGEYVPHWNDHASRTKFEVIDALRSAAKDVRNGL